MGLSYNIEHFTSAGGLLDGRREFIRKLRQGIGHRDIPSLSLLGWKQLLQPLFGYFSERLRRLRPIRMYEQCKRSIRANAKHDESNALAIQGRPNFVERSWSGQISAAIRQLLPV